MRSGRLLKSRQEFVLLLWGALLFSLPASGESRSEAPGYLTFGFLPIVSSERLVRRFSPLVDYLAAATDFEIRMETAPDFAGFRQRTQNTQRYDILFTAPHLYYLANRDAGYRSVVRVDQPGMHAVIVAPASSDIEVLEDLRGRRLATTGPLALSTVLAKQLIAARGLDPDNDLILIDTPSHNASLMSSYQGNTDASALMLPVYRRAAAGILDNMKIIAETQSVPHIPIAVAPWVDQATRVRLQQALLDISDSEPGREVLARLGWPGFVPTSGGEYDSLAVFAAQIEASR